MKSVVLQLGARKKQASSRWLGLRLLVNSFPVEMLRELRNSYGETLYMIRWIVQDKNGLTGEIYIINSFTVDPQNRHSPTPLSVPKTRRRATPTTSPTWPRFPAGRA